MMPDISTPFGYALAFALTICLPAVTLAAAVAAVMAWRDARDALARARFHARADRTWRAEERRQACRDAQAAMLLAALTLPLSVGAVNAGGDPRGALLAAQWAIGEALRVREYPARAQPESEAIR